MNRFILGIVALSLSSPAIAHDDDAEEKKRLVFKFSIDVPLEQTAYADYNPASFRLHLSAQNGFGDFLEDFLIDPQEVNIYPGHPYIGDRGDGRGVAHGFGRGSKYRVGDTVFLGAGQYARMRQTGVPFGVAFDFRPKGNTWISLGWQMSETTVIEWQHWQDTLRIERIDSDCCFNNVPGRHFIVDLSRHRSSGESTYRLTNHYVTLALKHDLFPDFQYGSLMPTAGGRLWTLRESTHRETREQTFKHGFFPERRDQNAQDALGAARNLKRDNFVSYQNTVQWFAGLSGEFYPWGKRGVFGIGGRAIYLFNNRDVESPDFRFDFSSPGWQTSVQVILAF